jgi:hypothetical protein
MQPKYKLSEPTAEEIKAFQEDFAAVLEKHSLYYEPVPQYSRKSLSDPWTLTCQIFIQKKTAVEEETPQDESPKTPEEPVEA